MPYFTVSIRIPISISRFSFETSNSQSCLYQESQACCCILVSFLNVFADYSRGRAGSTQGRPWVDLGRPREQRLTLASLFSRCSLENKAHTVTLNVLVCLLMFTPSVAAIILHSNTYGDLLSALFATRIESEPHPLRSRCAGVENALRI